MVLDITTPTRVALVATVVVAVAFGVYLVGRDRLRAALTDRFLYGIPWGSLVVIVGVFSFYLFAQSGLRHWDEPVTLAFRSWAYTYPTGMLTSGFAHNSPAHLLNNMLATVVLAPLAEFVWGHYPHEPRRTRPGGPREPAPSSPEPTEFDQAPDDRALETGEASAETDGDRTGQSNTETAQPSNQRVRDRPAVRAFVVFPGVVVAVSLLTSVYAFGWSLGFSGTVFALLGFVLLRYPIPTAVALLGVSLVNVLLNVLVQPVLRATAETGPPTPPGWAGVNVQAHLLGFLIGVVLALLLLWSREHRPDPVRLFLATVLVGVAQGLWQLSTVSGDVFLRYQGIGVIFVLLLSILITYVAVSENHQLSGWTPRLVQGLAALWLVTVAVGAAATLVLFDSGTMTVLAVAAVTPALALPGLSLLVPDVVGRWPLTTRRALFVSLVLITVIIALPSAVGNSIGIDDDVVPENAVTIDDYHVAYAENVSHGRTGGSNSGVVVVSEQRYIWSVVVDADVLAHQGEATVVVGDLGWRDSVEASRTGWRVVGNDSVYVVDLETDGETVRSFTSEPSQADVELVGNRITLAPDDDEFVLTVEREGEVVESTPVPAMNETTTAGTLEFATEPRDGTAILVVKTGNSRLVLAEKE